MRERTADAPRCLGEIVTPVLANVTEVNRDFTWDQEPVACLGSELAEHQPR